MVNKVKNSKISVGAQDCHQNENEGSFTGHISAYQLKKLGVKYVILGHSEKRKDGDTNAKINKKIKSAINQNLRIILCVGETIDQFKKNKTTYVIKDQITNSLKNIKKLDDVIIAYEPVWSIGTGLIPNNKEFKKKNIIILYGGSVDTKNINKLKEISNINGYLVGGSSRNPNKFIDIVKKTII